MAESVAEGLRAQVTIRAQGRCEYCQAPEAYSTSRFSVEHIFPRILGDRTILYNLALACQGCNNFKTVELLQLNRARLQNLRRALIAVNAHPPV